jgi:hypothetical protein
MGNTVWKIVKWAGNCILKIIEWWRSFKDTADRNTYIYIEENKYYIKQADNEIAVCETLIIKKQKSQLEEVAAQRYKNLSSNDRYNIDSLLARRDY